MTLISIVVGMDLNGVIGVDGRLPWHLPADLRRFRRITLGKPLIMGRRTHKSIGRPLPGRENIVLSGRAGYMAPGCTVLPSFSAALEHSQEQVEVMVIGGVSVYQQALPMAGRLYMTKVHTTVSGDVSFPPYSREVWREIEREEHPADRENPYKMSFIVLERA